MKRVLSLAGFLGVLWWLLSGQTSPLLLGFGVASVALVVWFTRRLGLLDGDSRTISLAGRLARFWAVLIREITVSNLEVVKAILSPRMPIQPHFLRVRTRQTTDLGKVILANSITLTPGTVTVDVQGDELLIHALTEASGRSVKEGHLDRAVHVDRGAGA